MAFPDDDASKATQPVPFDDDVFPDPAARPTPIPLPYRSARKQISAPPRHLIRLLSIGIVAAFLCGLVLGGASMYAYGSAHAARGSVNHVGWLMQGFWVDGGVQPSTAETVFLFWNISQTPHNLAAHWYLIDPTKPKNPLTDIIVDAASDGQGKITIIDHAPARDYPIAGVLSGSVLTVHIPPETPLFPVAPHAFVTLTFAPSTTDAFNQIFGGA